MQAEGFEVLASLCEGKSKGEIQSIQAQFEETMALPFVRAFLGVVSQQRAAALNHFVTSPDGKKIGPLAMNEDRWRGHINALDSVTRIPMEMSAYMQSMAQRAPKEK